MVHSLNTFFLGVVCILDSEIRERTPELTAPNNLTSIFLTIEIKKKQNAQRNANVNKSSDGAQLSARKEREKFHSSVEKSKNHFEVFVLYSFQSVVFNTHFCFVAEYRGQVR